ncbi:UNVERIFIED_CONTAM: hypothetical protein GTU68_026987 [Idotea baltica]|nr:hypothetical protein [Idotea baltica]
MTTAGDRWLSSPLSEVGGKGLFIKELEQAMLDGRAQLAVHSMKDLPAVLPPGFTLAAVGYRDDVRDALVSPSGAGFTDLPKGSRIGSSSLRRQALIRSQRPDLELAPVRGNLGTRLAKLDAGDYDALILASTGLSRLGLGERITQTLPLSWSVPAVGQGALGIECLSADVDTQKLLEPLNDTATAQAVGAERALSATLGASCSTPLGGYAQWDASTAQMQLTAVVASLDGSRVLRTEVSGAQAKALGELAAAQLLEQGAAEILQEFQDTP